MSTTQHIEPNIAKVKRVSFEPLSNPIPRCCDKTTDYRAVPSIRMKADGTSEKGYALRSLNCDCDDRWIKHDWQQGHAVFETVNQEAH